MRRCGPALHLLTKMERKNVYSFGLLCHVFLNAFFALHGGGGGEYG